MPGEWIKMRLELHDSTKVRKIARLTGIDMFGVVGRLHRVWGWVDQISEDGDCIEGERADIDEMTGCDGFAAAMMQVGWLQEVEGTLRFGNFAEHNGQTSKRRVEDAKRKFTRRAKSPQHVRNVSAKCPQPCGHFEDQEQEQEQEQESKAKAKQAVRAKKSDGSPPVIPETPEPPELSPVIAAVSAWGAGTVSGSAAARVALLLDTLARQHPIADPATGTDADPQAVCLALVADLRSKPDTPGPSQISRVRAYADAVLSTCAAEGRMPGAQSEWKGKKTKLTVAEEKDARCHKENGDWLDGQ